jgi:hypothetical protein
MIMCVEQGAYFSGDASSAQHGNGVQHSAQTLHSCASSGGRTLLPAAVVACLSRPMMRVSSMHDQLDQAAKLKVTVDLHGRSKLLRAVRRLASHVRLGAGCVIRGACG